MGRARALLLRPAEELRTIGERAAGALRAGRRPVLAAGAGACAVLGSVLYGTPGLRQVALDAGAVRAQEPLPVELARLPGSAFLPTPHLPAALAVLQLLLVLGVAELVCGARATAAVALAGHVASTLLARLCVSLPALGALGLPAAQAHALDTGPSAMTTAVGAWLLLRCRALVTLAVLGAVLVTAGFAQNDLDGREHLAALAVGAAAARLPARRALRAIRCAARGWVTPRTRRGRRRRSGPAW